MQRIIAVLSLGIVAIVLAFWWHSRSLMPAPVATPEEDVVIEPLSVVATFYPLGEFARAVGGDRVTVQVIVPGGAEPHDYEPTPQDILLAYQADIFLLNGAGLDPWAEKIRPELEAKGIRVVQMSELMPLIPVSTEAEHEEEEGHEEEHEVFAMDPHFWLNPVLAAKQITAIREALQTRDPGHQTTYERQGAAYRKKVMLLDTAYRTGLATCALRTVVTSHEAFGYLAQEYNLKTVPLSGISPEAEPTPKTLAEVATLIRAEGIKYIFFETLVSPKVAEALAREVGAETLVFNPLEGLTTEEEARGENYLSIMKQNLANLKTALVCQEPKVQ